MRKKVLFVYTNFSTFVKTDYEILSAEHDVTLYQFKPVKGLVKTAFQFIKQKIYLLFNIWKFDSVFIWFADYHSFLPVLFAKIIGKKSFVVVGGYDVARMPELGYGALVKPLRRIFTLTSLRFATLCLPVVEELEKKINELCPKASIKTVYTGYKFETYHDEPINQLREKIVLTVSITDSHQRFMIKGMDRFKELAENMPDYQFIMIGIQNGIKYLFDPKPDNLTLVPPLKQVDLISYYKNASFYAQFSRSEGLPNALCEAMLYGCIPVGTRIGGISTGIGNTGLIIDEWNARKVADYIVSNHNRANREACSARIKEKFDWNFRKEKLLTEISQK